MSNHILIKVYGHIWPVGQDLIPLLHTCVSTALPVPEDPIIQHKGDMVRFSFEGIYFPLDDVMELLRQHAHPAWQGKLDYIDMEAWTLQRHIFSPTGITVRTASLNHALDSSLRSE